MVGVGEVERSTGLGIVETLLDGEVDDVVRVEAVLGIVQGELADSRLVGMSGNVPVG